MAAGRGLPLPFPVGSIHLVGDVVDGDPLLIERHPGGLAPGAYPHLVVGVGEVALDGPFGKVPPLVAIWRLERPLEAKRRISSSLAESTPSEPSSASSSIPTRHAHHRVIFALRV